MYQPSQSATQSSQRSTDLAAEAVRQILAFFPDQTPTVDWTDMAIRTLQDYPPDILRRLPSTAMAANPKRIPPVPQLKLWADAVPMPTKSGRSLPPPEELSRRAAELASAWIRNNRNFLDRLAAHGYPLGWRQDVHQAAWLGAQRNPPAMDEPEINCLDREPFPAKPLPPNVLMFGQVIPLD
jgi:hypothetical protein